MRLARIFGLPRARVSEEEWFSICLAFMQPLFAMSKIYADTHQALDHFKAQGYRIGILSNSPWGAPRSVWIDELTRYGMWERCETVIFCSDVGWRKPAQPIFRRALPGAELETSTREIASVLREARSIAIRTNQETGVVFDVEEVSLAVAGGELRRLDAQITLALTTAASEQVSERVGGIRFFPDGTSTGGRITVSGANRVRFVVVDWLTGNVKIVKREDGRDEDG